ncbi:MAG: hypothetical protein JKY94_02315 [Rhodobacteraceae bacterium]|nr:hypothetical protein [Paracoccaceae bacterium]
MDDLNLSTPVACTLTTNEQRMETKRYKTELTPHVLKRERLADGARLTFTAVPGMRENIERLVEMDKGCCAFLEHQIESDSQTVTLTVRGQGQGIALAQEFLTELAPIESVKPRATSLKVMALVGACGLACSAPLLIGMAGLSVAGIGLSTIGVEFAVLALVAAGVTAYVYFRKKRVAARDRSENANRCSC